MVGCTERTITFPRTIGATTNSKEANANTVLMQHCLDDGQHRMVDELNSGKLLRSAVRSWQLLGSYLTAFDICGAACSQITGAPGTTDISTQQ
jgi:hypothetical protein